MTENAQRNREAEVNLLAAAREAQWSAAAFMGPNTMKLVSPAKVNLLLAIGARREDGYHDADTIMHALALHDTLYLRAEGVSADELARRVAEGASREDVAVGGPADNLVMTIDLADRTGQDLAVPAADNLAFKAADRLSRAVGRDLPEAIQLRIEKHIPAQGGLGSGSSNAAAVLVEYQRSVAALHDARPTVTSVIKAGDRTEDIKRKAYTFELEQIQSAYEDDRLSRAHAQRMRESVQLMQMDLEDTV